jgi:hypothetical protein
MAITGITDITDAELVEFIECVRLMMRDYGVNNHLLKKVQFEDKDINRAIELTVSQWNSTPPVSNATWRHIPEHTLFLGATRWLMQAESFLQVRNQISVQTDGLGVVGLDDKYQLYYNQMQDLRNEFKQETQERKYANNIAGGFGSLGSGYANVSRFHQS